jgi:NAD(P)H-dependent FMN reductase
MPLLHVIIASTRPGRVGLPVGNWIAAHARERSEFDVEIVDLAELGLPPMDEPRHPRLQDYQHDHTKQWSAIVERADAFAFVIPEYNFSAPPALLNALNYLHKEWAYKPGGIVSYGGVSAGLRSAQMTKQILQALKIPVPPEAVSIPFVQQFFGDDGEIHANDPMRTGADSMLAELGRWEQALRGLRGRT